MRVGADWRRRRREGRTFRVVLTRVFGSVFAYVSNAGLSKEREGDAAEGERVRESGGARLGLI